MTVRPAEPGDGAAVAEVFLAARSQLTYLPELHTERETRAWIDDAVLGECETWGSEENGRVVGYAALSRHMLEHLYVHPQAQGKGVGTELLTLAKRRRPAGFRLWVFQRNEGARRFYEGHGLRLVELTDGSANEEREPDALYEWRPAAASIRDPAAGAREPGSRRSPRSSASSRPPGRPLRPA
jgi:ribosomal protein S18 acetylase RimI-like enzyme